MILSFQRNKFKVLPMVLSLILVSLIFLPIKSCKKDPEEPIYTKLARIGSGFNAGDTTKPQQVDSTKIINDFAKKLGDTATIAQFQKWLYRNVSAEVYENVMGSLNPYLQAYYKNRYQDFLNRKK